MLGGVDVVGRTDGHFPARALALLAYLVTHPGTPQPRGHLADLLWPDSSSAQARTNLRRELHHLRGALGESDALEVSAAALTWRPSAAVEVDVEAFLDRRRRALDALEESDGHGEGFEDHLQGALRAYGGAFLPGCYDDWALLVRDELRAACVDLCDQGVRAYEQRGDPQAAIVLARRRIALEPLEEPGYRRLMALQQAVGDRAGALRTYHRCASLLEQELGLAPSLAIRQELDVLLGDPPRLPIQREAAEARGDADPARVHPELAPLPDLVGRETERRRLRELWSEAAAGTRAVLVTGEAGVGKTRLVGDLANTVRAQGGVVATARCFAATASLPLAPVAEWLRTPHLRSAVSRLPSLWQAEVDRLVPETGEPSDASVVSRAKVDAWQRLRFFEGLARAVLAVDRPLLLVIDDLQWCDSATVSWLSFLMSFPTSGPVLLVGTARDDEEHGHDRRDPLSVMQTAPQVDTVALAPLSLGATEELMNALVEEPLVEEELQLVHSVTAGNPFFVIEALRESQDSPGPVQPADLQGVLGNRLSRLSKPAREVLGLAAAVGRDFGLELLMEACDLDPDTVVKVVDELWRRRILDQRGHGYDFAHSLLRDAAYDTLTPARRWLAHRRLAQALELLYRDRQDTVATELAEQYERSGQPERALPFYDRAARGAASVFAHAEAVRLWQRCWTLLDATSDGRERDERQLELIEQMLPPLNAWQGYASVELEGYERLSFDLGERLGLVEVQTTACIALFATTFVQGHIAESHDWGVQALALAEQYPHLTAQAHMAVAGSGLGLGEVRSSCGHFEAACTLAGESDSLPIGTRTGVHSRAWWAHALWLDGDVEAAQRAAEQAVLDARSIGHPYSLAVSLAYAAITHQMCDDRAALEPTLAELTGVCGRYEFAYYGEWATVLQGWLLGGEAGIGQVELGIDRLERAGSLARMPYWLWLLADLHRGTGDAAGACGILDAAQAVAVNDDDLWWAPEVLRSRAALDPTSSGTRCLERAVKLAGKQASVTLLDRCSRDLAERRT